ncbi:MAG: metal-dependent hydrolase [Candidatus Aenigmatarchaeota archaeon]
MPLAVTHVLLTIILVDLYRDYFAKHKKYFTIHTLFIAGLGGILSDIDIPINWILGFFGYSSGLLNHGGITHTILFGLIFLIPAFMLFMRKKHKESMYFFVISFGILFHLFLDVIVNEGYYMLLWPLTTQAFSIMQLSDIGMVFNGIQPALDAIILLVWLYHEEIKHKIKDFI